MRYPPYHASTHLLLSEKGAAPNCSSFVFCRMWNSLDILTYSLQIGISVMFFGRIQLDSLTLSGMLALQILLLFWKARSVWKGARL